MLRHGYFRTIRQNEVGAIAELLDEAENVIPASAVEPGGVLAQFVQDFVHLKRRKNRFDQHRGANGPARNSHIVLGEIKDVVPQTRFLMALQLRQVKVGPGSARDQVFGVVEEKQSKIEQGSGDRLAIHEEMFFIQVPSPRANEQRRCLLVELIALPFRASE